MAYILPPTGAGVVSTTGNFGAIPTFKKASAVGIGYTSAGDFLGKAFTNISGAVHLPLSGPRLKTVAGVYNVTGVRDTGVNQFAYMNSSGLYIIRGYSTSINAAASTLLTINGRDPYQPHRFLKQNQLGADLNTSMRAGYWNPLGIVRQRNNWSTSPSGLNPHNFVSTTNSAVVSADNAQYVTWKSVPGRLVYLQGNPVATGINYKQDNQ
ncbi:MAG: hypothetical protein ACHQ1D_00525 [Nitrososphaerales archaeon]